MAWSVVALKPLKGGGYAARKVIPADVREDYARLFGRGRAWEENIKLPADLSAHEAKARYGEWLAEVETRIAKLRAAKKGEGTPLTRENAHALAGQWYSWFLAQYTDDLRTPRYWRNLSDFLIWDVIHPQAPAEY